MTGPHLLSGPNLYLGNQAHFQYLSEEAVEVVADKCWRERYLYLSGRPVATLARDAAGLLRGVNASTPPGPQAGADPIDAPTGPVSDTVSP